MRRVETDIHNILYPTNKARLILIAFIAFLLPAITVIVYISGGIQYAYAHAMYFPILLAGIHFGLKSGAAVAVIAGLLLGPVIPINTSTGEQQLLVNWVYRLCIFVVVGALSGTSFDMLRKKIKKITELSTQHPDTGIPNFNSLILRDDDSVKMAGSIVLNNYYTIINSLGKEIFTELMRAVYQRLKGGLNSATIIQADSSKIWLCLHTDGEEQIMADISKCLRDVFTLRGIPMYLDFSLGLAHYDGRDDIRKALQQADIAAFHAQRENLQYCIFDEEQMAAEKMNLELLGMFPRAMETGQTEIHYQPKINLKTKDIAGIEALIRWNHPERGHMLPQQFIKAVEETHLINPMTEWVLGKSLEMVKELKKKGFNTPVSINISAKNLQNSHFFDQVIGIIKDRSVDYNLVEFEMTESSLMYDPEKTKTLLHKIRDYNIRLSIDDFGTGYSSLAYLRRFPINAIKIDKYFIEQMSKDRGTEYIVQATIGLAHNLGLTVIAEGVENLETEKRLIKMGCDIAQGYYYSKPLHEPDIVTWFQKYNEKKFKATI